MFQSLQPVEKREQSIREEVLHKGFLWSRFFMLYGAINPQLDVCGLLFQGLLQEAFFAVSLFPACGHKLSLFSICVRDRALKAQQTVLITSPASTTRQQIFVCESLYELFSAYINKEGTSPSIFLVRRGKIEMAALEEIKFENMTYMTYRQTSTQATGFMALCSCYERALNKPCGQEYLWRGKAIKENPGISNLILGLLRGMNLVISLKVADR